jgi:hypothetical protein
VAEVVLAYCSSHAPMMSSAREAAPREQREHFLGALDDLKRQAGELDVQACVFLSNEHFTNFFLENFPQICIGVGEKNGGPTEEWLPIDRCGSPAPGPREPHRPGTHLTAVSTRRSPTNWSSTTRS